MCPERTYVMSRFAANAAGEITVVQEGDVLSPWQPDHHAQSVARGFVEEMDRGRRVDANGVDTGRRHQLEVTGDAGTRRKLRPFAVGRERAVRHTSDQVPLAGDRQKLSTHARVHRIVVCLSR